MSKEVKFLCELEDAIELSIFAYNFSSVKSARFLETELSEIWLFLVTFWSDFFSRYFDLITFN